MTLDNPLGAIAVIDIETEPDPFAVALAPRGGPANRGALHRITAFSVLSANEGADAELIFRRPAANTSTASEILARYFSVPRHGRPLCRVAPSVHRVGTRCSRERD